MSCRCLGIIYVVILSMLKVTLSSLTHVIEMISSSSVSTALLGSLRALVKRIQAYVTVRIVNILQITLIVLLLKHEDNNYLYDKYS